jgi:hypothetical protein
MRTALHILKRYTSLSILESTVPTNITSAAAVDRASDRFLIDGAATSTSRFIDIFLVIFVFALKERTNGATVRSAKQVIQKFVK